MTEPTDFVFRERRAVSPDEWNALVRDSPDGWLFGLHEWQQLVTDVKDWGWIDCSFAVYLDDHLVAVVPLQRRGRVLTCAAMGASGPVLARFLQASERLRVLRAVVARIVRSGQEARATRVRLALPGLRPAALAGSPEDMKELTALGFTDVSTQTNIVDLSGNEEELWDGVAKNARRTIQKAVESGLTVQEEPWEDSLDDYYRLHCETYSRTGVLPHPREYFVLISELLAGNGGCKLLCVREPGGSPVAYHNSGRFASTAHYWTGCSASEHLDAGVNYLAAWEAIRLARREGCSHYETGEVFPESDDGKLAGLSLFKRRFGGQVRPFPRAELTVPGLGLQCIRLAGKAKRWLQSRAKDGKS
jgi:hypothetical protein